jgi:deoxyadenosine/deoxycytidine kinase
MENYGHVHKTVYIKMNKGPKYLVIEGNIGVGKTSLCELLASEKDGRLLLEQFEENPFLKKFYENPERYALTTELSFLSSRYKQLKAEFNPDLFFDMIIADYSLMKSLIFASRTLQVDEFQLYRNVFDIMIDAVPKPDLYVYLHKTPNNLLKNIKKRGRPYEQNITENYLSEIEAAYFEYFKQQNKIKILVINTNNLDFVADKDYYKKLKHLIFEGKYYEPLSFVNFEKNLF